MLPPTVGKKYVCQTVFYSANQRPASEDQHGHRRWLRHRRETEIDAVERTAGGQERRFPLAEVSEVDDVVAYQIALAALADRLAKVHFDGIEIVRELAPDAVAVRIARDTWGHDDALKRYPRMHRHVVKRERAQVCI